MGKHTPGPYHIAAIVKGRIVGDETYAGAEKYQLANANATVATVYRPKDGALLKASPALYEACKRGLHWADCHDMKTADSQVREDIAFIRAALALAEGRGEA